jgi:hypothetical protein
LLVFCLAELAAVPSVGCCHLVHGQSARLVRTDAAGGAESLHSV